jgi:Domain of unknown function (DUF4175)
MVKSVTLEQRILLARIALMLERLWPRSWPLLGVISLFLAYALYDIPQLLTGWQRGLVLLGWVGGGAMVVWYCGTASRSPWWPSQVEAMRRLEKDGGALHQPLSVLSDQPARHAQHPMDSQREALWLAHCQNMEAVAQTLWPQPPHVSMLASDPWGVRFWVFVPLVLGLTVGGLESGSRIGAAFNLGLADDQSFSAWISPPQSTFMPPFVLSSALTDPVPVPVGSRLSVSVGSGWGRASLVVNGQETDFSGDQDQHVQVTLNQADDLEIRRFFHAIGHWRIQMVEDHPPSVAFMRPPEDQQTKGVRVGVEASDDYGLSRVWLQIVPQSGDRVEIDLPVSKPGPHEAKIEAIIRADQHSLAGQTVIMNAAAQDSADQQTQSDPVTMVWPQRPYFDPQAQALMQLRKEVLDGAVAMGQVVEGLEQLTDDLKELTSRLDVALAHRDLEQASPDIAEAQALMLAAANKEETRSRQKLQQLLTDMGRQLDQAQKSGDKARLHSLTQNYADMLEKMIGAEGQGDVPLSPEEIEQIVNRLDALSGPDADGSMRQRLQELAQKITAKLSEDGQGLSDPFGHHPQGNRPGGKATGDDRTTKVPGKDDRDGLGSIVDDIQGRLLDASRPKPERDYLKRLLELLPAQ